MASVEKPTSPPTDWKRSDLSDEDRQFARRLKARRIDAHLSRQSLAKLTQLSEATIKFIESGRTKPTVRTFAYLLQVPKLALTLDDVPPLLREQVRDVLELPRVPVCEAAPAPDCLRPCSGGGRATQLSEATIECIETGRTKPKPGTVTYLLQVTKLELTLDDVVPTLLREQVREVLDPPRVPVSVAAPPSDGLRSCSVGTGPLASESAQPEACCDRDTPPT